MQTNTSQRGAQLNRHRLVYDPLKVLSVITGMGFLLGLYLALIHAPTNTLQGEVQRIFYIHIGAFFGAFVGFFSTVFGGIVYLRTRQIRWDMLAHAGVEVGLVLALVNIATGTIYARPIVNSWWTWDPKLTAVTVMALTYAAYLMLRAGIEGSSHRRVFASVYGIFAFVTVLYTFMVIRMRTDTLHDVLFGPGSRLFMMPGSMQTALFGNMLIWGGMIAPVLIAWRIRLAHLLQQIEYLRSDDLVQFDDFGDPVSKKDQGEKQCK